MSEVSLRGRVAIVTGGGGGLGRAVSRTLARSGASVYIVDISMANATEATASVQQEGGKAFALCADIADPGCCAAAVEVVLARESGVDILVNSAGVDVTLPMTDLTVDQWDRVLAVNLTGAFYMAKDVVPSMLEQGRGDIVNIASTAAKRTWSNTSAYHASKWGLLGLSHALHAELRSRNIKVTAVVPGGMRTPFLLDRFEDIDISTLQDPQAVAETVRFVLCQPPGTVIPEIMVLPMQESSWP